MQLGSVILVMSGIILFAYADGFHSANTVGIVLSIGSAIGAAVYKVSLPSKGHLLLLRSLRFY